MKRVLVFLAAVLVMASCSKHVQEDEVNYVKVGLSVAGEISISQSPLTKAPGNDLYGFNVYKSTDGGANYTAYAIGLYDDISNITIELPDDGIYKFECRMFKDGKTRIENYSIDGTSGKYSDPFWASSIGFLSAENVFTVSSSCMSLTGEVSVKEGGKYSRAAVDSYYGVTSAFNPKASTNVSINMKRTVFGVKVVAGNLDTGSLYIDIDGARRMTITPPETEIEQILTLADIAQVLTNADYSETVNCKFIWQKDESTQLEIAAQDITFTRNKLTTINITIEAQTVDTEIGVNVESAAMTSGNTVNI